MKSILTRALPALILLACVSPAEPGAPLVVETVDQGGAPVRATRAFVYLVTGPGEPAVQTEGECGNSSCTRWRWDQVPEGTFYVGTEWTAPHPDPDCLYTAQAAE